MSVRGRSHGTSLERVSQGTATTTSLGSRIVSGSIENVVEVHDLVVRYGRGDRALTAVDGVSFTARAGQVTAVLGPNGAGKTSTTIRPDRDPPVARSADESGSCSKKAASTRRPGLSMC
ncbi:MAG: hypothetical protein RLZ86_1934 [Actinomycetota bacterium]